MRGEATSRPQVFTLGHSTRPIAKFLEILRAHSISTLVDIRAVPRSRHNPQFEGESLRASLTEAGIHYVQMKGLGGLRRPVEGSTTNAGWDNESFRGFADHMQTAEFEEAITRLIELAAPRGAAIAIMCAEGNPFRCHRSLVADALEVRGVDVVHISGPGKGRPHTVTSFARVVGASIAYPRAPEGSERRRPPPPQQRF